MEDVKSDDGVTDATKAVAPKKRGRPANPNKIKKEPSGRGRGRPAKQGKLKVTHTIEATGKGRGRPKSSPKPADLEETNGDDDEDQYSDHKPEQEPPKKNKKAVQGKSKSPKRSGRPKKIVASDEEIDSDDEKQDDGDEDIRPVGRPSTGAVNLNIVRTGRGQGRPKKVLAPKRASQESTNGGVPKKRGRPATGKKSSYVPTGRGRGRPKATAVVRNDSQDEEADVDSVDDGDKYDEDAGSNEEEFEDASQ